MTRTSWDASDPFAAKRRDDGVLEGEFNGETIPLILRYEDVRGAAMNVESFSSDTPLRVPIPSEEKVRTVRQLPIETDPPEHGDYRDTVKPFFNAPRRPETIARVEALVASMLDDVAGEGPVEVTSAFALPLQSRALTILLNMPINAADEWIGWGQHVFWESDEQSEAKGGMLDRYLNSQFDRVECEPGDDFFSALSQTTIRGRRLTRDEMLGFANLAFAGGRDTVISTISLALAHLATHPEDAERLRDNAPLIRTAVEEIVRIAAPLTVIGRTCPTATDVNGVLVAAGDRVGLCWASANRDESVFESPNELRIDRKRNPHLGFGAGVHRCLGASHARLVLRSLIGAVVRTPVSLELVASVPKYEEWPGYRRQTGYESLVIKFDR